MTNPIRLCINCANMRKIGLSIECYAEQNMKISPVTGQKVRILLPYQLRDMSDQCSPEAKWYEPRAKEAE